MGHSYQARLSGTLHLAVWVNFGGTCNMPTTVLLCIGYSARVCESESCVCMCELMASVRGGVVMG